MSYVEAFIEEVESWLDTPYKVRMSRTSKKGGSNCAQFVQFSLEAVLPKGEVPVVEFNHVRLTRTRENVGVPFLLQFCHEVPFEEIERGDIVILQIAGLPVQPAVFLGEDLFIYCTVPLGIHQAPLPIGQPVVVVVRPNIFEQERRLCSH